MINKRGALFHWIIFGMIGALGLFLFFASRAPVLQEVRGTWQQGLLYDGFFPAEVALQQQDVELQHLFRETAMELAENGGFQKESPCGKLEVEVRGEEEKNTLRNIWGEGCFPDILKEFQQVFETRLAEKYPSYQFSKIEWQANYLVGQGERSFLPAQLKKMPPSWVLQYKVPSGFSFDATPFLDGYTQITIEARQLLEKCRNERDAFACIDREKMNLPDWHHSSCTNEPKEQEEKNQEEQDKQKEPDFFAPEAKKSGERKLPFCVQESIFSFQFALDFTPREPFAVEDVEVLYVSVPSQSGYELRFPQDTFAESYKIYYTDALEFTKTSGNAEEVFNQVLHGFKQEKIIDEVSQTCPAEAERKKGIAYLCKDEVVYLIDDPRLTADGSYVFGVTALREGKESELLFLVKMEKGYMTKI